MSAHDQLERQLRHSVREQVARQAPRPARPARPASPRWPRHRLGALAATLLVAVTGVAVAGEVIDLRSTGHQINDLVADTLVRTGRLPACRPVGTRSAAISDATPSTRVTDALPALATFPRSAPPPSALALARPLAGQALLRRTVRSLRFPGGVRAVLYTTQGAGPQGPADPAACLQARLAQVVLLHPKDDDVQMGAIVRLKSRPDTQPGAETLGLTVSAAPRRPWIAGAVTVPEVGLRPGALLARTPLPRGRVFHAAIASPDAVRVTVRTAKGRRVPARISNGILGFAAPAGDRRFTVAQRRADGRPVGYTRLVVGR